MATQLEHSDPNKPDITVADTTTNTDTSLTFIGKNYNGGYSKIIGENFLKLLENFSSTIEPRNPQQGQLWFNTNPTVTDTTSASSDSYGLKIYDNNTWLPVGIIKKSAQAPSNLAAESTNLKKGDLYIDTSRNQLFIYTGDPNVKWTLIGPSFNATEKTGAEVELITDSNTNTGVPVLTIFVKTQRTVIISDYEFVPKSFIEGFSTIRRGINLSTQIVSSTNKPTKFWGIAEKAEALISGDEVITTKNFLRSDQTSTTNYGFNVRNNNGVNIGNDLSFVVSKEGNSAYLFNKISGSTIDLRIRKSNNVKTILRVSTNNQDVGLGSVGINQLDPQESLDVVGNIKTTGQVLVTSNDTSSIATQGGISAAGRAQIGGGLTVSGISTTNAIIPSTNNTYNLGAADKKWGTIFANTVGTESNACNFYGVFNGAFNGELAGQSTGFKNPITLQLDGDITTSTPILIQNGGTTITINTTLRPGVISDKSESTTFFNDDVILIQRGNSQLYKLRKEKLAESLPVVPTGTILLFAGDETQIPNDYLKCDGEEAERKDYGKLFDVIGYKYKAQQLLEKPTRGILSFALPDLTSLAPTGMYYIIYTGNTI